MRWTVIIIISYLSALVFANLLALYLGQIALIITALFLIPFDFILRAYFHEKWKKNQLAFKLGLLLLSGGLLTFLINQEALNIAIGSTSGFIISNIIMSIYYQLMINKSYFVKINISDIIGIIVDSYIFQLIAFNDISIKIMMFQIILKIIGGLIWYYIIFEKYKLHKKWL